MVLVYIGQTGRPFPVKCISLCNKVKKVSHCDAGVGVSNESNSGRQKLHWDLETGR